MNVERRGCRNNMMRWRRINTHRVVLSRPTSTEGRINGVNVMTGADDNARIECRNGFKLNALGSGMVPGWHDGSSDRP